MWRIVGLAGCLACGALVPARVTAATPGPDCVASQVEGCIATMKNVFATPEQNRAYCVKAAQKACEPKAQEDK